MVGPRLRRLLRSAHLALGVTAGVILAVVALTGGVLAFYVEIDRALVPQQASPGPVDLDRVVGALRAAFPERGGEWRLELPHGPGLAVVARHATPRTETGRPFAPLMVAVDPVTGRILAARRWGDTAMTWIYDLHYTLLAGETGRLVLAVTGIADLGVLVTGVILWWPAPGKRLRGVMPPRLRPGAVRRVFDLHVVAGVYGGLLLLPLLITGVVLEQPQWFGAPPHHVHPEAAGAVAAPSANRALAAALARFPDATPRWVYVPPPGRGTVQVRLFQSGDPGWRFPGTSVWVGTEGDVLMAQDARQRPFRDAFFAWQHPLHNGEAFGLGGRLAVALAGVPPLLLVVTGIIRWRQKRAARAQALSVHKAAQAPDAVSSRRD